MYVYVYKTLISFLYVCMVNTIYLFSFVETPRKFIIAELSIHKHWRRPELTDRKLCNNKFTWCFHKAKQVYKKQESQVPAHILRQDKGKVSTH